MTGTLISGVGAGDEVELFPGGQRLRVRGVESGGKSVQSGPSPGSGRQSNLAGIDHHAVKRGMTLAAPGRFRTTRRMDVRLTLLPSARKLKHRAKVHFHTGTAETIAEVLLYGQSVLSPGQTALGHLRLQEDVLLLPGDAGSSCGNFHR